MTYNSRVGTYTYPTNHIRPHVVTAITGHGAATYEYDANGNTFKKNGVTIAYYDYDNRPTIINGNAFVTRHKYTG